MFVFLCVWGEIEEEEKREGEGGDRKEGRELKRRGEERGREKEIERKKERNLRDCCKTATKSYQSLRLKF